MLSDWKSPSNRSFLSRHVTLIAALAISAAALGSAGCDKKKGEDQKAGAEPPASEAEAPEAEEPGKGGTDGGEKAAPDPRAAGEGDAGGQPEAKTPTDPTARPGSAQAQMIIVGWKGGAGKAKRTEEQAKALAEKVVKEAKKGDKKFAELVLKYSDGPKENGGRTAPMTETEASKAFKPVFELKKGEISDPIKGPGGYFVFKRLK
jgi:hypothetical protein